MPRPKTGDNRAAILRAATETIAKEGIGASTAKIAKAAAVAEGSLFRYFADKDELYLELKLDIRRTAVAGFRVTGSLPRRVQHIWNAFIGWGMESPAKRNTMVQLNDDKPFMNTYHNAGQSFGRARVNPTAEHRLLTSSRRVISLLSLFEACNVLHGPKP